jgi:kynurenine formamidase
MLLGKGKLVLENVAHLVNLPPVGARLLVMPLKLEGATESPVRLIGILPTTPDRSSTAS